MKRFLIFLLVLAVVIAAVGYWRGWFIVSNNGKVDVQVNQAKLKQDKETFTKTADEKAKELKEEVAKLWKKSEHLSGNDKAQTQKELEELQKKQQRLEEQIKELNDAGPDKFESIKQDLTKSLADVEKKIDELEKKLDKEKAK